jgi:hypothetical protein
MLILICAYFTDKMECERALRSAVWSTGTNDAGTDSFIAGIFEKLVRAFL